MIPAPLCAGPMHGLRVLDLTQFLSGPYGTMILGDLGADVVKVEPPNGELSRTIPPNFVGETSSYYLSVNRNKRSVVADLKESEGLDRVRRLALAADVVIENFRPGVLQRLGISYEELSKQKPGLIWCSISGFGQDGPWRNWPAYDMVVQALSGGMSLTGEQGGEPVRAGIPIADVSAGMFAVIGILSALNERNRTGRGRWVDVAMYDCQLSMLSYQAAYFLHSGQIPLPQGSGHDSIPTYRTFVAGDGLHVVTTANTEKMWRQLVKVLGRPELASDLHFTTNRERFANRDVLWPELEEAFRARSAADWMTLLIDAGVPAGVVNTLDEALINPHAEARKMVLSLSPEPADVSGAPIRVAGNPIKFVGTAEGPHRYPPALGLHNDEVVCDWLGPAAVAGRPPLSALNA
jgi:crotonobetainyl-CoA:carnitine CoA-transferase CaiB-like acyl-CoA transferase